MAAGLFKPIEGATTEEFVTGIEDCVCDGALDVPIFAVDSATGTLVVTRIVEDRVNDGSLNVSVFVIDSVTGTLVVTKREEDRVSD